VKEDEIKFIVSLIDRALMNRTDANAIAQVRKEVNELMSSRPLFAW
jgi:glycine hydroxymethyltransferase